jgi:hypothetical protein
MREHWASATFVLQTLGMQIGPLDKDGLDLIFTRDPGTYARRNVKNFDIPKQFCAAMEAGTKAGDNLPMYKTSMALALRNVLRGYIHGGMRKKLTLIVLTAGVWDGVPDDAEREVAAAIKDMMSQCQQDFYPNRWFGIEFVSFGNDEAGLSRLQGFDDNMGRFDVP